MSLTDLMTEKLVVFAQVMDGIDGLSASGIVRLFKESSHLFINMSRAEMMEWKRNKFGVTN